MISCLASSRARDGVRDEAVVQVKGAEFHLSLLSGCTHDPVHQPGDLWCKWQHNKHQYHIDEGMGVGNEPGK